MGQGGVSLFSDVYYEVESFEKALADHYQLGGKRM